MSPSTPSDLERSDLARDETPSVSEARCVPHWYVVRTRSRHEKVVRDQLIGREVETFLPLVERLRVLNTVGVADLVGMCGRPEPVPDTEIEAIQLLAKTRLQYDPHPFLSEGMEVEVVRGPLAGVRGKLLRKDRMTRLVLAVTLIRQAAIVEVHPADVVHVGHP